MLVNGADAYIGASKESMGIMKLSLHESGVWAWAATKESGATFGGNRRAQQWERPPEHSPGVTMGPVILVPNTTLGHRPPYTDKKQVEWFPAPRSGEVVQFAIHLLTGGPHGVWGEVVLGERPMANGGLIVVTAGRREPPPGYEASCERLLHENPLHVSDPTTLLSGSFLWVSASPDDKRVPVITDMPVPLKRNAIPAIVK